MPTIQLSETQKDKIQAAFPEFISKFEASPGGEGIVVRNAGITEFYSFALAKQLMSAVPKLDIGMLTNWIEKAAMKLVHYPQDQQTLDSLINIVNETLQIEGVRRVKVTFFLNINRTSARSSYKIGRTEIVQSGQFPASLLSTSYQSNFKRVFGDISTLSLLSRYTAYSYEMSIPAFKMSSHVVSMAGELFEPIDRLRSLLNFAAGFRLISYKSSIRPQPRSHYVPSPLYLIEVDGQPHDDFLYEPTMVGVNPFPQSPKPHVWDVFDYTIQRLNSGDASNRKGSDYLWNLLLLNQKAADSSDNAVSFLHYWQILERIASPNQMGRGMAVADIVKRLSQLLKISDTECEVLKTLGAMRNEYAHAGEFPSSNGELFSHMLKRYTDVCIGELIDYYSQHLELPGELEAYLDISVRPAPQRASFRAALNLLQQHERQQKQLQK